MADLELLSKCMDDYSLNLIDYTPMQNYYDGKTKALTEYKMITSRANNLVNVNMVQKFVNEEASYCVGNPVTHSSQTNNKEILEDIRLNLAHWSSNHNKELGKQALIFNEAYELYYFDKDGLFSSIILTPKDSYILKDNLGYIELCIRFYRLKFDLVTIYADVYDNAEVTTYIVNGNKFTEFTTATPHYFSKVPVGICKIGTIFESIYNNIRGSQDGYETVASDIVNEISDFRNAYLKLIGAELDNDVATTDTMKKSGIMQLPIGGDASWLVKQLDDSFIQNTLNTLKENMYELTSHINHNDKLASNTSSLALKNRLIGLSQKCSTNMNGIKDCIKTRLQFLFEYLKIKESKDYDYRDVNIKLTALIPSDDLLSSQILSQNPNISKKTGYGLYSFIDSPENEMKQLEKEQNANSIGNDLLNPTATPNETK